jgi:hypothetical protein
VRVALSAILLAIIAAAAAAQGRSVSLRNGESVDLFPVYWISWNQMGDCISRLNGFDGVDMLEGPPGLVFSVRPQTVRAVRQPCRDPIPGGIVVVGANAAKSPYTGVVRFRVRYNTQDGPRESSHSFQLQLTP